MNEATDVPDSAPVFVDPSGRRRRIARNVGIVVGCLLGAYLVIVTFGIVTGSRVPLTPWPEPRSSTGAASHGHGGPVSRIHPSRTTSSPQGTRPTAAAPAPGASPTTRTTTPAGSRTPASAPASKPASTSASPTPTHPGQGHGYGTTRSPHPKKS